MFPCRIDRLIAARVIPREHAARSSSLRSADAPPSPLPQQRAPGSATSCGSPRGDSAGSSSPTAHARDAVRLQTWHAGNADGCSSPRGGSPTSVIPTTRPPSASLADRGAEPPAPAGLVGPSCETHPLQRAYYSVRLGNEHGSLREFDRARAQVHAYLGSPGATDADRLIGNAILARADLGSGAYSGNERFYRRAAGATHEPGIIGEAARRMGRRAFAERRFDDAAKAFEVAARFDPRRG